MNFPEKIGQLRQIISDTLTPLITRDYLLLDVPYHGNIGDTLIWQGETDFLNTLPYKCKGVYSAHSWRGHSCLRHEAVILLNGGGNFGDLWDSAQDFRTSIIQEYPDNRIVMFPQSVWYDNPSSIKKDAEIMARHKDLHLCARDQWSYDFLKKHFGANHIYLVPDMAFFINDCRMAPYRGLKSHKDLYIKRIDKEILTSTPENIGSDTEIRDWPTLEHTPLRLRLIEKATSFSHYKLIRPITSIINKNTSWLIMHPLVTKGCKFLSSYNNVTTTRLHVLILSILLHKPVTFMDNCSGKISAFAQTWLKDLDDIKPYDIKL